MWFVALNHLRFRSRLFGSVRAIRSSDARSQRLRFSLCLLQLFFGGWRLFMTIVVIVIARSAPNLRSLAVKQRNDGVVRDAPALHAVIVNDIT